MFCIRTTLSPRYRQFGKVDEFVFDENLVDDDDILVDRQEVDIVENSGYEDIVAW
jgi:hypothetical protein